jgi:hypothetical protein
MLLDQFVPSAFVMVSLLQFKVSKIKSFAEINAITYLRV